MEHTGKTYKNTKGPIFKNSKFIDLIIYKHNNVQDVDTALHLHSHLRSVQFSVLVQTLTNRSPVVLYFVEYPFDSFFSVSSSVQFLAQNKDLGVTWNHRLKRVRDHNPNQSLNREHIWYKIICRVWWNNFSTRAIHDSHSLAIIHATISLLLVD